LYARRSPASKGWFSLQAAPEQDVATCNPCAPPTRAARGRALARPVLLFPVVMKDIVFVAVTVGFFWISYVYAKSFDRL
jgi:hypothetical protein